MKGWRNIVIRNSGVACYPVPCSKAKENDMKTFLATVAALGLMTSAVLADCAGHQKVTASTEIDKTMTTASISQDREIVVAKKKPTEQRALATD